MDDHAPFHWPLGEAMVGVRTGVQAQQVGVDSLALRAEGEKATER